MVTYCDFWNGLLGKAIRPRSEASAMKRFDAGRQIAVVADERPVPRCVLDVKAEAGVRATFFYASGSIRLIFVFGPVDGRMFLDSVFAYTYEDDSRRRDQRECQVVEMIAYSPDGVAHFTSNTKAVPNVEDGGDSSGNARHERSESRDGVDVSPHWEPMPVFGQWESFMREDRGPAV